MTEKNRQSTVQHEQTQGFNSPPVDEINLIDLLKFLARKKVLILAVTSVCTLFAIFYAQSITPIYRATVRVIDNNEVIASFSPLKQLDPTLAKKLSKAITKPYSIFERFLLNIKSYAFKKEVFVNGGFQKKFSSETGVDTDQSVSSTYNSTKIVTSDGITNIELDGSKPKVMLEFLTALVESAKEDVNTQINVIQSSIVKNRIENLSKKKQVAQVDEKIETKIMEMEIEELIQAITLQQQIENKEKAMEIDRFSRALVIAKRMGIKNTNFTKLGAGANIYPLWFLYGELGLQQQIMDLRSEEKNPKTITALKLESELKLKRLQQEKEHQIRRLRTKKEEIFQPINLILKKLTADLPLIKFKVATISKHSYFLVKPYQRPVIVGFGVAFGLFIGIFMAFLIDQKQLGAKEIASTST